MYQPIGLEHPNRCTVACRQENKALSLIPPSFRLGPLLFAASLALSGAIAQDPQQNPQDIPDAPSATRPMQTFPTNLPPARPEAPPEQPAPKSNPDESDSGAPPAMPPVKTVPAGSVPTEGVNSRDDLYT